MTLYVLNYKKGRTDTMALWEERSNKLLAYKKKKKKKREKVIKVST